MSMLPIPRGSELMLLDNVAVRAAVGQFVRRIGRCWEPTSHGDRGNQTSVPKGRVGIGRVRASSRDRGLSNMAANFSLLSEGISGMEPFYLLQQQHNLAHHR